MFDTRTHLLLNKICDEDFSNIDRCHDWRNHVDKDLIKMWGTLSKEAKLCIYIQARNSAEGEEWE